MKKVVSAILIAAMCLSFTACSYVGTTEKVEEKEIELQASQMQSICELATMQCYYHNVAKYFEEDASGILWWKKDRKFWVEYSGVVTIGIDASLVTMENDGDTVAITIPPARVLGCKVDEDSLTEASFIIAENSAAVEAEHQTAAFKEAQSKMQEAAEHDAALLASAQQRAQKLLEDYVHNIGNSIGKTYRVKWVYTDGNVDTSSDSSDESENTSENT